MDTRLARRSDSWTRIGIVLFVLAVAAGPLYTVGGYSTSSNLISELAAQNTPRNYLMASAFVLLGAGILADGLRAFRRSLLPFLAFGVLFGAAGLFGHKPIVQGTPYVPWVDAAHSLLATLSGVSLTIGFAWQAVAGRTPGYRWGAGAIAVLCIGLPLSMLALPAHQGSIQRLMYLVVFAWLWRFYPRRAQA
jgi:hypothetical protein